MAETVIIGAFVLLWLLSLLSPLLLNWTVVLEFWFRLLSFLTIVNVPNTTRTPMTPIPSPNAVAKLVGLSKLKTVLTCFESLISILLYQKLIFFRQPLSVALIALLEDRLGFALRTSTYRRLSVEYFLFSRHNLRTRGLFPRNPCWKFECVSGIDGNLVGLTMRTFDDYERSKLLRLGICSDSNSKLFLQWNTSVRRRLLLLLRLPRSNSFFHPL